MPSHLRLCTECPSPHRVEAIKLTSHLTEIRRAKLDADNNLTNAMSDMSLADGRADIQQTRVIQPTVPITQQQTPLIPLHLQTDEGLADLLTGLVITDEGPAHWQQPSKLFSSRGEVQEMISQKIPDTFGSIPASAATRSIATLVTHQIPVSRKKERGKSILQKIKEDVCDALRALDIDKETPEEKAALRTALEAADTVRDAAVKSLKELQGNSHLRQLREEVEADVRVLDKHIDVLSAGLPPITPTPAGPERYDATHVFSDPTADLDLLAQITILLVLICNVIIGIATAQCDFILETVKVIIQVAMSSIAPGHETDARRDFALKQIPPNLAAALKALKIDSKTTVYAVCPSCSYTHAPKVDKISGAATYPPNCENAILNNHGSSNCGEPLLELRLQKMRPIKPFVVPSFEEYLARLLADPEIERMCDKACDDAWNALDENPECVKKLFHAKFMKEFRGPDQKTLFIERKGRMRLAFEWQLDFFNPNGTRKRGNHDSIGILSAALMNLDDDIRNKPQYVYVSIIPGPHEPDVDEIAYYSSPLVDVFVKGWERGLHISPTGSSSTGRDVDLAVVLSINDLPAARKISGMAGTKSNFICTVCNLYHAQNVWDTDFLNWTYRDVNSLRQNALDYKNASTLRERERIFKESGVRWSELWRLPYWNPTRMLVIDAMHCVLEGIVHYHCRRILRLDLSIAKGKETHIAFDYNWPLYDPSKVAEEDRLSEREEGLRQIDKIQEILSVAIVPADSDMPGTDEESMRKSLKAINMRPLRFVTKSLGLDVLNEDGDIVVDPAGKALYIDALMAWRLTQRLVDPDFNAKAVNLPGLKFIQRVIADTTTPSWINSVPSNYGESNAGTIKADEWRILATIYIPLALVLLWGDQPKYDAQHVGEMLAHSMALFQAVTLVCKFTASQARADDYRLFLKQWVDGIRSNHPHTEDHNARINVHAAFHIYDFVLLFGPIMAWWCFPFERLIGALQKINTNDHIGGELEGTIVRSFWRGANLRRHLSRPDCPELIKQFKVLFDLTFSPHLDRSSESLPNENGKDRAHYTHQGVNYSRASTHLGNSLVMYYPSSSATSPIAGSIQRISAEGEQTYFHIQRQAPLPLGKFDPFLPFPHFPAKTYSSSMDDIIDKVQPISVLSHCARLEFSDDRAVILDLSRQ